MSKFGYLPHTDEDRQHMLRTLGMTHIDELFSDIPDSLQLGRALDLPAGLSEWSLMQHLKELAGRNRHVEDAISFLGAGAYHHHIPSVVDAIIGRSEFYTAYTPYQPEISQGILQAIFEYQTLVCELMGLDVSNASLYDGPTALGEAAMMACSHTRRNRVLVTRTVHPEYRSVLGTYARGQHADVVEVPMRDGLTDMTALASQLSNEVAAVIVSYPNFFGGIEEVARMATMAHEHGALLIVNTYPIALGLLESPGVLGADIAVAEGQSLGNTLSFGGPYLGMMAVRTELVRKLPGRIAGQTKDRDGRRGFVLTLQAREQHIRREKASSNICSNQALNALAASVYLADLGPQGLAEVGTQCMAKARYAESRFAQVGFGRVHDGPYFHEFVLNLGPHAEAIYERLADEGIYLGYPLGGAYPELAGHVLVAVTEVVTKDQIDETARRLEALR
ncbi:MAG: aminomethyl-transferring glycine dehydrogenase subunit GcvPA [Firmicutes bacterium]|nr:aminomethyl-transferring glycine dehydrogenase subunit GcvPA [Bacillota bacterium]